MLCDKNYDWINYHTSLLWERNAVAHFPKIILIKFGNKNQLVWHKINYFEYAEVENYDGDAVDCMRFSEILPPTYTANHL